MTPFTLWKQPDFDQHSRHIAYFFGVLFGILIIMFFYNLFISLTVRDRTYLYYILFVASVTLMTLNSNGFSYMYFWPEYSLFSERMQVSGISFVQVCGILFTRRFLNTRETLARLDRLLIYLLLGHCAIILSTLLVTSVRLPARATLFAIQIYAPLLLIIGILSLRQGNRSARFFLLGWISSIVGSLITVLTLMGVIRYHFLTINQPPAAII